MENHLTWEKFYQSLQYSLKWNCAQRKIQLHIDATNSTCEESCLKDQNVDVAETIDESEKLADVVCDRGDRSPAQMLL